MSGLILLARHASHGDVGRVLTGRGGDVALSDAGLGEAGRLADALARRGTVAAIHSSPQRRARETAQIVGERLGLAVAIEPALDEIDFGDWTGRPFADLADDPAWAAWNERRAIAAPPGGEPMAAAAARIVAHVEAQVARGVRGLLCVTHCDMIRGAIAHWLGLALDRLLRFDIDPASLSTLVAGPWGARITGVNEVAQ